MSTEKTAESSNLVSIICRTIGRAELAQALESVAVQSYSPIETILVNSAKIDLSYFNIDEKEITVVEPTKILSRAEAANSGLDAASGNYLMFLDDDDWIAIDHVTNLVSALEANSNIQAVYSSAQKTNFEGKALDHIFNTDFNPYLLMRDNYIPIHTMLFRKALIDKGCRFDNLFDIYEDWDFWLQLSQHTQFEHIPNISAFYRAGGDSDTDTTDDTIRFKPHSKLGKARADIFKKWKSRWDGNQINLLLADTMRMDISKKFNDLSKYSQKIESRFEEELKKTAELEYKIPNLRSKITGLENKNIGLENKNIELVSDNISIKKDLSKSNKLLSIKKNETDKLIFEKKSAINKLSNEIQNIETHKIEIEKHLQLHINQLEDAYNKVINSATWRMLGPLRIITRLFKVIFWPLISRNKTENVGTKENDFNNDKPKDEARPKGNLKVAVISNEIENSKKQYAENAKTKLSSLLKSDDRLVFPKNKDPRISIILVFYNQAHLGLLCLESLLKKADVDYELVIVDNASSKETNHLLDRIDNARLIKNQENLGFVKAVNQGVAAATGKFILLLNNDAVIENSALSNSLESISDNPEVGAVGAQIKLTDGTLQEAGSIIWKDGSCMGYGRGQSPDAPDFMFKREVDYCSGAFLLFRREHFNDLGGFDLDYSPAYYEESDFCIRLQKRGLKIIYDPKAKVTHYEFGSSEGFKEASFLQKKNQQTLCRKHKEWLSGKYEADLSSILNARSANNFSNILFIDDRVPHPNLGSGYPRCAHLLNKLAQLDLNITLYPLQFPIDDWNASYQTLDNNIEIILGGGRAGLHTLLTERKNFFEHIIVSRVHNMEFFKNIITTDENLVKNTNIIYDAEALTANRDIMKMEIHNQSFTKLEKEERIKNEINHASIADSVIAVSGQEAKIYEKNGVKNVHVLGHCIDPAPGTKTFEERVGLLFVGALRDEGSPNIDSLLWFTINVLPLIEREIPSIKLYVVGDHGAASLFTINKKNVLFKGKLDTVDEMYNQCRVFIAPTRFAAGIPHKVHEAASRGIPSVTTELLAHQLQWHNDKELLVGTDATQFARQCVRLHQDSKIWNKVRKNGLDAVKRDCSDSAFEETLKMLVT
ncbi:MAG: glycosyltransferase [Gammaproteobacteria bacterium]|nr:glycosyltransferase [Gammaproteobacteria bacterium]